MLQSFVEDDTISPCITAIAGYSIWTNYSFKMPVLAGAFTCLISNVLYITSYQTRSLGLLVLSRFVLGFGAPDTHFILKVRQMSGDYASQMHSHSRQGCKGSSHIVAAIMCILIFGRGMQPKQLGMSKGRLPDSCVSN